MTGAVRSIAQRDRHPDEQHSEMMRRYLGDVIVAAMADDDVTEIYVNPQDGGIRLDTRSRGRVDSGSTIEGKRVRMFLNAVADYMGVTIGTDSPRIQAELPNDEHLRGSRLQGFLPPLTSGPAFNLRKPPAVVYPLTDYVKREMLPSAYYSVLCDAVESHRNILIAGGTNTGKTTFANAVIREISDRTPADRIVILEDTVELQCTARDHLALRTAPGITLADLVKSTLRTSPNRIIVGEVRDEAALDLLDAWATGHPGGVATFHATDPLGALIRLDRLAQRANVPSQMHLVTEAVHYIVMLEGGNMQRRVSALVRVTGLTADCQPILQHLTDRGQWENYQRTS